MKRFFLDDCWFGDFDLRIDGRIAGALVIVHTEHKHILTGIVDRNVLLRLEKSQLAHALSRNPAGGEVGHAARIEFHPDVRYVSFSREDWQTYAGDFFDRRGNEWGKNVQVMEN